MTGWASRLRVTRRMKYLHRATDITTKTTPSMIASGQSMRLITNLLAPRPDGMR